MHPDDDLRRSDLVVELEGRETLEIGPLLSVLGATLSALTTLAKRFGIDETSFNDWSVVDLRKQSPAKIALRAPTIERQAAARPVVNALLDGINRLEKVAEPPPYFDDVLYGKLRRIVHPLNNGLAAIRLTSPDFRAVPTLHMAANIRDIELRAVKPHFAWTTLQGRLEDVTLHGKFPKFVIYDQLNDHPTICVFETEEMLKIVKDALPSRVEVYGCAKYGPTGEPREIAVERLAPMQPSKGGLGEIKVNITGGDDAADYIRRMRDADE